MPAPNLRSLNPSLFRSFLYLVLATPILGYSAPSDFGMRKDGTLDQPALAAAYMESDWEPVTATLEGYLRKHGDARLSLEERIFAYKYLGVIYAADSVFHSKSESYFNRLLDLSPKVEIFDLYPSKKVNDFFREVKREHADRMKYAQNFDVYGRETGKDKGGKGPGTTSPKDNSSADSMSTFASRPRSPQPMPVKNRPRKAGVKPGSSAWIWWTVGIAAAAGTGAYVVASQDPGTKVIKLPRVDPD